MRPANIANYWHSFAWFRCEDLLAETGSSSTLTLPNHCSQKHPTLLACAWLS